MALLIVLGGAAFALLHRALSPLPPLEVSYWYWHRPFHITTDESRTSKTMGVRRLFVRAGTYKWENGEVRLTDVQQWTHCPKPLNAVLVFDYDPRGEDKKTALWHKSAHWMNEVARRYPHSPLAHDERKYAYVFTEEQKSPW